MESFVTVLYDGFVMPTVIKDLSKRFSSGMAVEKQKEYYEKRYETKGPTTTIYNNLKVEKDENPFLYVLALEIHQEGSRTKATSTSVDLGKLREAATVQQLDGEKDLNTGEVRDKDATSSPLGKEQEDVTKNKEGDRAFNSDAISSPSFEKKGEDLNAGEIRHKTLDEDASISSPSVSEGEEENLNSSKESSRGRRADSPRQYLSPFMILLQLFDRIASSKIGMVLLILCFASSVIGKSEGNQVHEEPNCDWPKEPISKLYFLKPNETCTSFNVNLQCANGLIVVCLPVVPGSDLAVGCAQDRPINGKGCPEWNNDNGCYVLNVRHNECETCSDLYLLSDSSEVEKCFKDERAKATEQTTGTSAKGTPDKGTSFEHGDETTAGSPNKTSGKSEGNNEPEIVIIIVAVVMLIGTPFVVVAVIKVRNRCRNPDSEQQQPVDESATEELQPVAQSNPEQQQPFVRSDPKQQQPFVRSDPEQQVFPPNGIYESDC